MLLEELFDAGLVWAEEPGFGDHQRLMAIADVVGEQAPLLRCTRLDDKHRLGPLHDDDDGLHLIEDEAVAVAQDRTPRKEKTKREPAV